MEQETQEKELSQREINSVRNSVAKAVFEDKPVDEVPADTSAATDDDNRDEAANDQAAAAVETKEENTTPKTDDPWASLPAPVRTEIETLRKKVSDFELLDIRLKQAERRIGAQDRSRQELEAALKAEREEKAQLTKKQREAEEKQSEETWSEFMESEPEIAAAIDKKVRAITGTIPKPDELMAAMKTTLKDELMAAMPKTDSFATKEDFISLSFPTWQADVKTEQFKQFLIAHPEHQSACQSYDIGATVGVLRAFDEFKKPTKSTTQIKEKQKDRLRQSATDTTGRASVKESALADLPPDEMRSVVGKKAYESFQI